MNKNAKFLTGLIVLSSLTLSLLSFSALASNPLISSISKAPISPDGNVAGAITDFVIDLNTSLDPAITGRSLLAGRTIKVTLPEQFINQQLLPVQDVFSSASCVPGNLQCSTAVLLQGWPQHPLLPAIPPSPPGSGAPQYSFSFEAPNTFVFTANVDITPGAALTGPGIKQVHLLLYGFTNPSRPGHYPVTIHAETGPDGALETGMGKLHILPHTRPSINVTSAFNPGSPNTFYQKTIPGELTPLPYDFLLWGRNGKPLTGVSIEMVSAKHALLKHGKRVIGHIKIRTPSGASGHEVFANQPSSLTNSPISAIPAGRLTSFFRAGNTTGHYELSFVLNGGNSVKMFVEVQ